MMKLDGEDAIVGWPNAKETIIDQRDAYMARTLYAAATGASYSLYTSEHCSSALPCLITLC